MSYAQSTAVDTKTGGQTVLHLLDLETRWRSFVWKGAISFGLVQVPVSMFPATQDSGVDFDWLDRRSLEKLHAQEAAY